MNITPKRFNFLQELAIIIARIGWLCILLSIFLFNSNTNSQEVSTNPAKIGNIIFSGNNYFSNSQLQDFIFLKPGTVYTPEQLNLDIKNIIDNFEKEGFLDCRIDKVDKEYNFDSTTINISVNISEGKQILIGDLVIEGNKVIPLSKILDLMYTKIGKVLKADVLNQDMSLILNAYEERGYTFASISVKDISRYSDNGKEKMRITINITENEKINIDRIIVQGNTDTDEKVILRELRINKNTPITRENISEIKRRLENLGYFSRVDDPKIYKYKNETVLLLKVEEGNTNTFDGILGYMPSTDSTGSGYFTGLVNLSLKNLFGTGRRIDARWEKEVKTTQELELSYIEPWVLSYPINMDFGFRQRIQDSTYIKRNIDLKADGLLGKYFTLSASLHYERVIPSDSSQTFSGMTIFNSRILSTGFELKFDNRDYIYNPSRGFLYRASYIVGQKKIYNSASFPGQNVPSDFTVQRGIVDLDIYYSLFRRQSFLLSLHGGEVKSPRLENADYFRFGGSKTVRGYREEQFLASRVAWSNFEVRYSLSRKSFASVFYDMGYYKKPYDDIAKTNEIHEFIYGYGLGIRVETGIGIFGINYALGKGDSFLDGKLHFGLVNDF
jgi:outer membrane protein insertion porin family